MQYAVWLYFKNKFRNSCIYDYSLNSLKRKTGHSRTMLAEHFPRFIEWGWCERKGKHLMLTRHSQLPEKKEKKKTLFIMKIHCKQWTIAGIYSSLQVFLIKDAQRKQQYASSLFRGDMRKRAATCENLQGLPFTVYQAKRLFKTSLSTATRILLKLAKERWFNRTFRKPQMIGKDELPQSPQAMASYLEAMIEPGVFSYKGRLYKALPSLIDWLPEISVEAKSSPNNM